MAVQELLRDGYLEESGKPEVFRNVIVHRQCIDEVLNPLDLAMRLDTHRGIAVLTVCKEPSFGEASLESGDQDDWSHPLVRRQRLTLEQSLLVAILRQAFVMHEQEIGVGGKPARISLDDLLPQYLAYVEDSGSDARNETRLLQLLEQLKGYGIVTGVDANREITIRPLIAHLADPASLAALLETMRELASKEAEDS
ncbi:MAG: DUF4194 domain-containing protein [Planctomycetales bacterium]|nr:DUF4194 domain-containing protein [Planctomycetales bacterium]MCA9227219.1 DUF4194 domain-containing protein [Planctomycetales bacterium]